MWFDLLPEDCIRSISTFLTPSEQDHMITLTLLSMDDFNMCTACDVQVASWNGRCYECHMNRICPECCIIPTSSSRFYQSVGVFKKIPNVCSSCYTNPIPTFSCFFCSSSFFALDGHRIIIESDNQSYEQVICMKCIDHVYYLERWKKQWISISIRTSSYGAKLWYGPVLPLPEYITSLGQNLTYRSALLLFMQQTRSIADQHL